MVVGTLGDAAMGPLIGALDGLKGQIKAAMAFADNAQKASLALGQTYEQTRDSLGSTMEGLRGDINQRFGAAIAGMEAGLQGNTAGVAKLINQQQLTGTAYQATAKAFASLEAGMNLSRDDTNALSDSLIETGAEWGVSTDKLVQAIDALKATFPAQKLAGMGKEVMQAVTQLQGELGPSLAGPLQSVMTMVMDTSEEGFAKLTKLGLGGVREQIAAAKSSEEVQSILKDAFVTASETFKMHTAGSDQFFRKIGVATENLGQGAIDFTTVADAFGDRTRQEIDQSADFGQTLENLKNEIMVPFQEGLTLAYPFLVKVADVLSGIANTIGQRFKAFTEGLGSGEEALKNLQLGLIDFAIVAIGKLRGAFAFAGKIITEGIPMIIEKVQKGFFELYRPGGMIDQMKAVFLRIIATINDFQGMSLWDGEEENAAEERAEKNREAAKALEKSIENNKDVTFEAVKEAAKAAGGGDTTSPLGLLIKDAAEAQAAAAQNDPTIKALEKTRQSIVDGNGFARQGNDSLEKLAKETEEINDKTPEITTQSEFLGETANMLSESIENILGIGADTTTADMLEELRIANAQRAAQEPVVINSKTENNADG